MKSKVFNLKNVLILWLSTQVFALYTLLSTELCTTNVDKNCANFVKNNSYQY